MQGDHIHIAFNDDDSPSVMCGFASQMRAIKQRALVEYRCIRRIKVFRLAVTKGTSTEANDAAAPVANWKGDASAKPVIGRAAAIWLNEQTGSHRQGFTDRLGRKCCLEPLAGLRREAQPESLDRLGGQAAPVQISPRLLCRFSAQTLLKPAAGIFQHLIEGQLLLLALVFFGRGLGQLHATFPRQLLHCLRKRQPLVAHDKADDVAVSATAKAVEKTLFFADRKGRRFFIVKRAEARELTATLDQPHAPADHLRQRHTGADFIQKLRGKLHQIWP